MSPAPKYTQTSLNLFAVVPLDLTVRTASDVAALEAALEAGLYVRSLQVDVRVDLGSFINLKKVWSSKIGEK